MYKLCLFFLFLFGLVGVVRAADYVPPTVVPIDNRDTRYIANQPNPGSVTSWQISTGKQRWVNVLFDKSATTGGHQLYLNSMSLSKNTLSLADESGKKYTIDISKDETSLASTNLSGLKSTAGRVLAVVLVVAAVVFLLVFPNRKKHSKSI